MTFATEFYDWAAINPSISDQHCSPNLLLVLAELQSRWPVVANLGCYGLRTVRGGTTRSTHSWGAAIDVGYDPRDDERVSGEMVPFLVAWSAELGVDAIHDYRRCRIWRAGRTLSTDDACDTWWKAQRPSAETGMGQSWCNHLHLETPPSAFHDERPISERGVL